MSRYKKSNRSIFEQSTTMTTNAETPFRRPREEPIQRKKREISWKKTFFFAYLHFASVLGLYHLCAKVSLYTWIWLPVLLIWSSYGTGAGAHRLWTHRTYKAKLPLKILLAFFQTMTFQRDIYDWVRDHRIHHKYSDTECDPHNASKGFFYSHIGWLMLKKEDCVIQKGKQLDLSDLEADKVIMFQRKYYWYLFLFVGILFPAVIPWYFWNESPQVCWYICILLRITLSFHGVGLVNSAAHIYGTRPYDKNILPTENLFVSWIANGEGFHNYHHSFPWDYKAGEFGSYYNNWNAALIDLMAKIGWAYDLKSASTNLIEKKINRSGDGSWKCTEEKTWGWGDKDMDKEDIRMVEITYRGDRKRF